MNSENKVTGQITQDNRRVFAWVSHYLNQAPDLITREEINEIVQSGVSSEYAFQFLLAAYFGMDITDQAEDKELFDRYFRRMIRRLDPSVYEQNAYYRSIRFPEVKVGSSELKYESYKPYEGFVYDDILRTPEGRQIPRIGFFEEEFKFPAVLENERIWMTVTPNEIETMKQPVEAAFGRVLTFGLGLGYYAYMVSEKDTVDSVTVVERNPDVIKLFQTSILPQFKHADKIRIINADAFEYAASRLQQERYDVIFTDLWHDVSDGMDLYLRMKTFEKQSPESLFLYWIEQSILCYL